ncbi:MAG: alpha-L-fucosidase [Tannerella sp.]|jgi:alpha-L-fucosidase|nr:alpha-L-fucosidase [Tannerella sp.]
MKKKNGFWILVIWMAAFCGMAVAQSNVNERARWFVDARYGMFIHWGVYSGAEGFWKGEKLRNNNDYAEWIFYRNQIGREEYVKLLDRFDWDEIDPEKWVLLAKQAGMKYITLTAKHHDGFALWDSKVSDYDIGTYTKGKRDIVAELAAACRKHGLKMGLYYSHWVDWEHRFGWNHERELTGLEPKDYDVYWQEKVIPQIRELLTNYGEISILWFDMWIHHSESCVTKEQLLQLKSLIRELQPSCLVNSRLGLSIEEDPDIDFKTLGDNHFGSTLEEFPWQTPGTVAHSWGYHSEETSWKSTTSLLKYLISNVSLNGNYMLNIGPRANGDVNYETTQRLLEIGKWLEINGEAIYGAKASDIRNTHNWGKITTKTADGKTRLYLHVFNWPLSKRLPLTGVATKPTKAYLLADKQKQPLKFVHNGFLTDIQLPVVQPDNYVSVVVLEYDAKPEVKNGLVAVTTDGDYSLTYGGTSGERNLRIKRRERDGTVPEHVVISAPQTLKWTIYIDRAGKLAIDASYSYQGEASGGEIVCSAAGKRLTHKVEPTGKTVGEPNSNWVIDRFLSHRLGEISFPEAGVYEIEMRITPANDSEVKFQWGWITDNN